MTLYLLTTPDGSQVLTDLDQDKHAAWRTRAEAELVRDQLAGEYGELVVVEREVVDWPPETGRSRDVSEHSILARVREKVLAEVNRSPVHSRDDHSQNCFACSLLRIIDGERAAADAAGADVHAERLALSCKSLVDAMRRYEMDVDDPPPFKHLEMMGTAEHAIAAYRHARVRPSATGDAAPLDLAGLPVPPPKETREFVMVPQAEHERLKLAVEVAEAAVAYHEAKDDPRTELAAMSVRAERCDIALAAFRTHTASRAAAGEGEGK